MVYFPYVFCHDFKLSVVHVCLKFVNPDPCGDSGSERLLNNSGIFWHIGRLHWAELTVASIQNIPLVWCNMGQSECVWALDTEVFPEFCVFVFMSWVCTCVSYSQSVLTCHSLMSLVSARGWGVCSTAVCCDWLRPIEHLHHQSLG